MFAMPHDDVVKNFDLEELSGADEIASDADVRLGRIWLAAYAACGISGVMPHRVLCRTPAGSPRFSFLGTLFDAA